MLPTILIWSAVHFRIIPKMERSKREAQKTWNLDGKLIKEVLTGNKPNSYALGLIPMSERSYLTYYTITYYE